MLTHDIEEKEKQKKKMRNFIIQAFIYFTKNYLNEKTLSEILNWFDHFGSSSVNDKCKS